MIKNNKKLMNLWLMQAIEDSFWHEDLPSRIFEPLNFKDEQKERSISFLSNLWYSLLFDVGIDLKHLLLCRDISFYVPVLATRDDIKVKQKKPHGEILISRGAKMWKEGRVPPYHNFSCICIPLRYHFCHIKIFFHYVTNCGLL